MCVVICRVRSLVRRSALTQQWAARSVLRMLQRRSQQQRNRSYQRAQPTKTSVATTPPASGANAGNTATDSIAGDDRGNGVADDDSRQRQAMPQHCCVASQLVMRGWFFSHPVMDNEYSIRGAQRMGFAAACRPPQSANQHSSPTLNDTNPSSKDHENGCLLYTSPSPRDRG